MIVREPEFVQHIAKKLSQFRIIKFLLASPYHYFQRIITDRRNSAFRKNGMRVLDTFDKTLSNAGIEYCLAFGSMLGAVREKGFISHDLDMDVAIWYDEKTYTLLKTVLAEVGFKLFHELSVEEGKKGLEQTFVLDDVSIDIFWIYPAIDTYPYVCDFVGLPGLSFHESMKEYGYIVARRLQLPWTRDNIRVPFGNLLLPIPTNAHQILSFRYGEDYMIPNPNWHYTDLNKYITVWKEEKAILKNQ